MSRTRVLITFSAGILAGWSCAAWVWPGWRHDFAHEISSVKHPTEPLLHSLRAGRQARAAEASGTMVNDEVVGNHADLEEGLAEALKERQFSRRLEKLAELGGRFVNVGPEQALRVAPRLHSNREREAFLSGFIEEYAKQDAARALDFAAVLPPGMFRNGIINRAISFMAEQDPQQAAARISQLLTGADAHNATLRLAETWAWSDPSAALAWAQSQADHERRAATIEQIAAVWGQSDPEGGIRQILASATLTAEERDMALGAVAATWAMNDPEASLKWASAQAQQNGSLKPLALALMNWGTNDPAAVAHDLARFPQPEIQAEVIPVIANNWGSMAPKDASAWAVTLPPGESRDNALRTVAESWSQVDAEAALRWALSLAPAEAARTDAIRSGAAALQRFDGGAFDRVINSLGTVAAGEIKTIMQNGGTSQEPMSEPVQETQDSTE